jgi:hypothetical protein
LFRPKRKEASPLILGEAFESQNPNKYDSTEGADSQRNADAVPDDRHLGFIPAAVRNAGLTRKTKPGATAPGLEWSV